MNTFDMTFEELKHQTFTHKQIFRGIWLIARKQKPFTYLKFLWELFTTIVVYSPGVSTFSRNIITSIRTDWQSFSQHDQVCIIAAFSSLNKNGRIDRALSKYKYK